MTAALTVQACRKCGVRKPIEEFHLASQNKSGRTGTCKACQYVRHVELRADPARWAQENEKQKVRKRAVYTTETARVQTLRSKYKLTPEQFDAKFEQQRRVCAICESPDPAGKGWCIDHDHGCCSGKTTCGDCRRAILCNRCNPMIGLARDNASVLRRAAEYLESNPSWPERTAVK